MAWTQTDIDALKAAIAAGRGAKSIVFGDQTVTFHSVDEMRALLRMMQEDVSSAASTPRTRYAAFDKGTIYLTPLVVWVHNLLIGG
jgi:hypothetical protein